MLLTSCPFRWMLFGWFALSEAAHAANPMMPGADPHAVVVGNTVWLYPTWSERRRECFYAFSSTNLTDWQRHGPVLDLGEVRWVKDDGVDRHGAWAPGVLERGGKWYFYYSVGPQNPTPSRIGVAVGDGPQGPFGMQGGHSSRGEMASKRSIPWRSLIRVRARRICMPGAVRERRCGFMS